MSAVIVAVRNIAIIAVLALALAVIPGGGSVASGLLAALSLIFLAAIGLLVARGWEQTSMTRDLMNDRQRATLYGSLGAIALMIAGLDEMLDTGAGTVAWLVIVGVSAYLAVTTWREASSY
jgi:diacylglycerol kinase family enzyme